MKVERVFTKAGQDSLETVKYETRKSKITNPDGSIVFEMNDAEVPSQWSQLATDILVSKYFRKAGVPQYDENGNVKKDDSGKPILGAEHSIKQIVRRMSKTWRYWGERYSYFSDAESAQAFEDEISYMLVRQFAAPNSPQWFNTGLSHIYGISGPAQGHYYVDPDTKVLTASTDAYSRPQPHACFIQAVKDDLVNEGGIMDLWMREARLFKYGSGTGTNFSNIRGEKEALSGGGVSSGLLSFLKIGDRAAGAIKSGGTTRRAAKMVILNADHPDIIQFVRWKMEEEKKARILIESGYSGDLDGEAYSTVSGQNSNNTVRVEGKFMRAVENNGNWNLIRRIDGKVAKTIKARELWKEICEAAHACADPGLQFDTTINEWHTCPADGRINASNPCSEYMFLDDTACNLASLNLTKFYNKEKGEFNVSEFRHAIRLWTIVLEISVLMAQYPGKEIAQKSYEFRTLGLGYANLGTLLMIMGLPYDSEKGRAVAAAITSIMSGEGYATSAEMAKELGPFPKFRNNREHILRVIRNHRRAAYNAADNEYESLSVTPKGMDSNSLSSYLSKSAKDVWDRALELGTAYGYRNAQVSAIAPTGTIGLLMDCDTTGVEPDFALVKFKKLAGGGYFKIANQSLVPALKTLGYSQKEVQDIMHYVMGTLNLKGAPHINRETLKAKGLTDADLAQIEDTLPRVFELKQAFVRYALGEDALTRLGFAPSVFSKNDFNLLTALGFTEKEIEEANEHICGTQTAEGAPHLKQEHLPVFDCANRCGMKGKRLIHYNGHIKMMAAVQPFVTGAISKTVNMPNEVTVKDVEDAYLTSWKMGLKAITIYRDGSKAAQPLASKSKKDSEKAKEEEKKTVQQEVPAPVVAQKKPEAKEQKEEDKLVRPIPRRVRLPKRRHGFTVEARINGQKIYLRTGEYEDHSLGEIFIDMHKEGASFRSLLNSFAIAVSLGLQYGVPLEEYVDVFSFTRFDPQGFVDHPNIKRATSVLDYIFRLLALEYLGRSDLVQNPPTDRMMATATRQEAEKFEASQEPAQETVAATKTIAVTDGGNGNKAKIIDHLVAAAQEDKRERVSALDLTAGPAVPVVAGVVVTAKSAKATTAKGREAEAGARADTSSLHAMNSQLAGMMGDAPLCDVCGNITVRNGTCYRCLNCGHSMGCS